MTLGLVGVEIAEGAAAVGGAGAVFEHLEQGGVAGDGPAGEARQHRLQAVDGRRPAAGQSTAGRQGGARQGDGDTPVGLAEALRHGGRAEAPLHARAPTATAAGSCAGDQGSDAGTRSEG